MNIKRRVISYLFTTEDERYVLRVASKKEQLPLHDYERLSRRADDLFTELHLLESIVADSPPDSREYLEERLGEAQRSYWDASSSLRRYPQAVRDRFSDRAADIVAALEHRSLDGKNLAHNAKQIVKTAAWYILLSPLFLSGVFGGGLRYDPDNAYLPMKKIWKES